MSKRHHKKPQTQQPQSGKKAQEREHRQRQARQRVRLHTFTAMALMVLDKWNNNEYLRADIDGLPANERRFLKMQIAKCLKVTRVVVRQLHDRQQWASPNSAFFQDASALFQDLLARICTAPATPELCRHMDIHSVMTYIIYAALYEWQYMETDEQQDTEEVQRMIASLGVLADHLITNDSPFLQTLNDVFWATRDHLHSGAILPLWDFSKCPKGTAEWERRHKQAA